MRSLIVITILIFMFMNIWYLINCQISTIDEQKCTKYMKENFEIESTFSFLIYGAPLHHVTTNTCKQYSPFIVGGTAANPKEFPHMARLGRIYPESTKKISWFCGGALISEKYILTAAHCFYSNHGKVNVVRLGELDFSKTTDDANPKDFGVIRTIPHPQYDFNLGYNDIGLIELNTIVQFNSYIHPACLPVTNGDEFKNFIAIGWGQKNFAGANSEELLKVNLKKFTFKDCQKWVKSEGDEKLPKGLISGTQICAGSDMVMDTCNGDSGGPLLTYHASYPCMYQIVGITSEGIARCGTPNIPALYTRVYGFLSWIRNEVW